MLQIKKRGILISCKINMQYLARNKRYTSLYKARKQCSQVVTLRAPKHFNIGKHKIFNLNYKTPQNLFSCKNNFSIQNLYNPSAVAQALTQVCSTTPLLSIKSCVVTFKTKIKLVKVAGNIVFLIIVNAFVFSFIFWILTFISKYYYSNKYYNTKLNFYECGFKSLNHFQINYSVNFLVLVLFLLLYDGEFLILIPFSFNIFTANYSSYLVVIYFLIWLYLTLLLDYIFNALEWQI